MYLPVFSGVQESDLVGIRIIRVQSPSRYLDMPGFCAFGGEE
jgi:hypothetical protein